jgi:hypothetical protein
MVNLYKKLHKARNQSCSLLNIIQLFYENAKKKLLFFNFIMSGHNDVFCRFNL